ncbi:hypothetical protein CGLO_11100 [Colletotrichum gloeosporioides Cg-14]|uniref:DUF6546 domain-containing protein n=1 Tax=Colletotrichum gloeosporioides (strain Cg-14) TaxID=1237896 RepID=T0LMS9_COLGC|nr:hypothetical protein CGLO_11100 [Colletotrichum gloeosporioides Cg-14]
MLQLVAAGAEWQTIIEKESFASLKLQSVADILRLGRIVDRRRERYIKRIRLHIELADYGHDVCQLAEDKNTMRKNNRIFSRHLILLLNTLSQWKDSSGVTLDLSAASRSDALHSFKKLERDMDDWAWANISLTHGLGLGARKRTLGSLLNLVSHNNAQVVLPPVPVVTRFILTRRHFRSFSPETVRLVLGCFPDLEQVAYEPYAGIDAESQSERDAANTALLRTLPKSTRTVSLWEYDRVWLNEDPPKNIDHDLVLAAVEASHRLESLCVTFALEAHDFFSAKPPSSFAPWRSLHTLSLTSSYLTADSALANKVLLAAGEKAQLMPQSRIMELWHHARGKSSGRLRCFLFRYEAGNGLVRATIHRDNLSAFSLAKEVKEAWKAVAGGMLEFRVIVLEQLYASYIQYPTAGRLHVVLRQDLGGGPAGMGTWSVDM